MYCLQEMLKNQKFQYSGSKLLKVVKICLLFEKLLKAAVAPTKQKKGFVLDLQE